MGRNEQKEGLVQVTEIIFAQVAPDGEGESNQGIVVADEGIILVDNGRLI